MSQLFARVELLGSADQGVYKRLHEYMLSLHWYQQINGSDLPHATYEATNQLSAPDLIRMGNELKAYIETYIWTKALVLVIRAADWAKTAG